MTLIRSSTSSLWAEAAGPFTAVKRLGKSPDRGLPDQFRLRRRRGGVCRCCCSRCLERVLKRIDVRIFAGLDRLVQGGAAVALEVAGLRPARVFGNEEAVLVQLSSWAVMMLSAIPLALRSLASCSRSSARI